MNVAVCVPWIETGCRWRASARDWTTTWWQSLGCEVVFGTDDSRPVCRSRARNLAAAATDADVLFFADADTWVPREQFDEACRVAAERDRLVLAYTTHLRMTKSATVATYEGRTTLLGQAISGCSNGAVAVPRSVFDAVGGFDERFRGWGYEDRCFMFACDTLAGASIVLPGESYHLWHPRSADQARTTAERREGAELAMRYKRAAGVRKQAGIVRPCPDARLDPVAMRMLLSEPGGPLAGARV